MEKTAMPVIAGIMNLVIGFINLLGVLGVGIAIAVVWSEQASDVALLVLWIVFGVLLVFSVPSIIGGIYALQRRNWVIALLGSVGSFLTWNLIGLAPLILVILSRNEFDQPELATRPRTPLEIARDRFTDGEISREEYEQIKKDLY